jgi:uncharacterized BrkB/YihY/UPF0761 family membrane protein
MAQEHPDMLLLTILIIVGVVVGIILLVCLDKFADWLMATDVPYPIAIMLFTYVLGMLLFHRHD